MIENAANNAIGGIAPLYSNTVSGNGLSGVLVKGSQSIANQIKRNLIGTVDAFNSPGFGNVLNGVHVTLGASNTTIGDDNPDNGNTIFGNGGNGVLIDDGEQNPKPDQPLQSSTGNVVRSNKISGNTGIGIDLGLPGITDNDTGDPDEGPNRLQNYPEIDNFSIDGNGDLLIQYKLDTDPANANYGADGIYIEFFKADPSGQGETFLDSDLWTENDQSAGDLKEVNLGNADALGVTLSDLLTSTASDADGNTSEFIPVGAVPTPTPDAVAVMP